MTTPRINTVNRGGARYYIHPETGEKVPGVTSILNMLPKSFLQYWRAKVVAEYAADNLGALVQLRLNAPDLESGRKAVTDLIKRSPDRDTKAAADLGTKAHDAFEEMLKGNTPRVAPDVKPFVALFERFIEDQQPKMVYQEETVYNDELDYMGSFDGHGSLRLTDGLPVWFDWKTTRSGIHAEVALQLAAYRNAKWIVRPDGTSIPVPKTIDKGLVVHVRPEKLQVVQVDIGERQFEVFKSLRHIFRWVNGWEAEVIAPEPEYAVAAEDIAPKTRRRIAK